MIEMNFLPITVKFLHEAVLDCLIVEGKMKENFGPWMKDEEKILTFNFEEGSVTEFADDGVMVNSVAIGIRIK
jgi:hypothetical protein